MKNRPHDAAVVELLKADPDFANEYLAAALEEADEPGGQPALLPALRHVAETQGMAAVAERAGIPRESLSPTNALDAGCASRCICACCGGAKSRG
jgi:DNA-binding phage protein